MTLRSCMLKKPKHLYCLPLFRQVGFQQILKRNGQKVSAFNVAVLNTSIKLYQKATA